MKVRYKVIRTEGSSQPVELGEILYPANYDYGLANDDTRATGIYHISLCKTSEGYPVFTIPEQNVEIIE